MATQVNNNEEEQKEISRIKKRNNGRLFLTTISIVLGFCLIAGTILDYTAFSVFDKFKDQIHQFTELLFTSCVGLLCLLLGFERITDFDNIESTLHKLNKTLLDQNKHFGSTIETLNTLSESTQNLSLDSRNYTSKIEELSLKINPPTILDHVNWKSLIKQSNEINFVVQGWDGWMEEHSSQLEDFARSEGKFNLFVINPQSQPAEFVRELMVKRLDKTINAVEVEITNTVSKIQNIFRRAKSPTPNLRVTFLNDINWYFAAQFKSKTSSSKDALVISVYSHHQYTTKDTPAVIFYRDSAPKVFDWFEEELEKEFSAK